MSDVVITFGAALEELIEGVNGGREAIEGFKAEVEQVANLVTLGFGTEQVVEFVQSMAELGEQVERTSAILGTTGKETQEIGFIAAVTGTQQDALAMAMERLQVNLQKAATGSGPAAAALQALGLSAKELIGLPLSEQMDRIADAVSKFGDGGNKTAIVMELLGRSGAQMIPVLDQGRAGLDALRDAADQSGAVMSESTIHALSQLNSALTQSWASLKGLGGTIVGEFAGDIIAGANAIKDMSADIRAVIDGSVLWQRAMLDLETGAAQLGIDLLRLGVVAKDVFTLNWGDIATHWQNGEKLLEDNLKDYEQRLEAIMAPARKAMQDALSAGQTDTRPQAPPSNLGAGAAIKSELAAYQDAIKIDDEYYKQASDHINALAKLGQITETQKTQQLLQQVDIREATELFNAEHELALGNLSVEQQQRIQAEITQIRQKAATDRQKIRDQEAEEEEKKWQQVGSAITSAFNSQTQQLLSGAESFGQAMKNIFADMVVKIINELEKIVIEDYIIKGLQVAIFGPAGALPSFDVGTNYVASSGLAMVHVGETIIPAAQGSGPYTGSGQGGGNTANISFQIQALDGASVQSWLTRGGGQQIAQVVQQLMQRNPSLRPAY